MRSPLIARLLVAASALAVAATLLVLDREHERCRQASEWTFLASEAPASVLAPRADALVRECRGAEPLTRIAAGLRVDRPQVAARLARIAAAREPESYVAWGVLAVTAPPREAAAAAKRVRALNPLSAAAGP